MEDGEWQGEEEDRLHFRDPRSRYTVIPRDAEGGGREKDRERQGGGG